VTAAVAAPGALTGRRLRVALAASVAVAVLALLLPIAVTYDAWGWLVWGREVVHRDLDTTGGPSWKPLPVLPTAVLSLAGSAAPAMWLVVARTGGLLALVAVYRLAHRWGGWVAGAVAAGALVLTPDDESGFVRLVLEGHVDAVTATLALVAVERHLDGHRTQALLLATAVALSRPEAWPFLAGYALWLLARRAVPRWVVVASLVAVPVLWFGGDWWGSGDWWHGADAAQVLTGSGGGRLERALDRAGEMVPWPVWIPTAYAVVEALRRRDRSQLALAGLAAGWSAVVVGMCVAQGYAALGRFFLVAAAVVCIGAGLGVAAALEAARRGGTRAALVPLAVVVAAAPFLWPRVHVLRRFADEAPARARFERDLAAAVRSAGGREAVLACGAVAVENRDHALAARPALAWELDVPLSAVWSDLGGGPGVLLVQRGSVQDAALAGQAAGPARLLGTSREWAVYAVGCPEG